MLVSGEQLHRAAKEFARGNARLKAELRRREFESIPQFLGLLQHALESVEIHQGFSRATQVAWKVLSALRVEGD